jgi:hypothetical protein
MNSPENTSFSYNFIKNPIFQNIENNSTLKFSEKNERKILKAFLLASFHQLFHELFQVQSQLEKNGLSTEYYVMDNKIIQLLLNGIVETGEYTLEGIAYHTRIPFDVLYEAACGFNNQFSVASWSKIVNLYMQLKPDVTHVLIDKLLEIKKNNLAAFSSLLDA